MDPNGGQIGIKPIEEARWLASQLELDLVEVAPDARPPVVRLMDYGKFKYEQSVKAREARKKQTRTVVKEVQFRPKIGASDFEVKRKRVVRFLQENDKVKVTMRFRGRALTPRSATRFSTGCGTALPPTVRSRPHQDLKDGR